MLVVSKRVVEGLRNKERERGMGNKKEQKRRDELGRVCGSAPRRLERVVDTKLFAVAEALCVVEEGSGMSESRDGCWTQNGETQTDANAPTVWSDEGWKALFRKRHWGGKGAQGEKGGVQQTWGREKEKWRVVLQTRLFLGSSASFFRMKADSSAIVRVPGIETLFCFSCGTLPIAISVTITAHDQPSHTQTQQQSASAATNPCPTRRRPRALPAVPRPRCCCPCSAPCSRVPSLRLPRLPRPRPVPLPPTRSFRHSHENSHAND